jgi:type IX secretion system PorP/SprF family membrane protein
MNSKQNILYIFIFVGLFLVDIPCNSQQTPAYSQFMMNRFLLNPARTGAYGYTAINVIAREQWLGLQNSPKTHAISFQSRILKRSFVRNRRSPKRRYKEGGLFRSGRIGIGGYLFNDQTGAINRTGGQLTYAYHINMRQSQLSFGLSTQFFQFNLKESEIKLFEGDEDDPLLLNNKHALYIPDASVGVYFIGPGIFAGLSGTQLFQSSLKFGPAQESDYKMMRYYYGIVGYEFVLNRYYKVEPSLLVKSNDNLYSQFDINCRFYYKNDYWSGLSFRTGTLHGNLGSAIVVMGGLNIDNLYFGYAFDYTLNSLQRHSFGSHELTVAIKFGDSPQRYRWLIRY